MIVLPLIFEWRSYGHEEEISNWFIP